MFQGFTGESFGFFMLIRLNNNKAFFEENKAQYERSLKKPLYDLAADVAPTLASIDPSIDTRPVRAVARIRRSTRYTRDKSPYRDHLWIGWRDRDRQDEVGNAFGFYFDMNFTGMNCGAGYYAADPATMRDFRARVEANPAGFERIVDGIERAGFTLHGEDYKKITAPDTINEHIRPYYVKKSFYVEMPIEITDQNTSPYLVDILIHAFEALKPLYQFAAV